MLLPHAMLLALSAYVTLCCTDLLLGEIFRSCVMEELMIFLFFFQLYFAMNFLMYNNTPCSECIITCNKNKKCHL